MTLCEQLARALADPGLQLGFAGDGGFADEAGRPVPPAPAGRVASPVQEDGRPVAVLVHLPALLEDEERLRGALAAARAMAATVRLAARIEASAAAREQLGALLIGERRALAAELRDGAAELLEHIAERVGTAGREEAIATVAADVARAAADVRAFAARVEDRDRPADADATAAARSASIAAMREDGHTRSALADLVAEHERVAGELEAVLADLRASWAQVVEVDDAQRRTLERRLHDEAQQRVVALALDLRLARRQLPADSGHDEVLAAAEDDLRDVVSALRDIAGRLHPHILEESGLAAALLALSEGDARLALVGLPEDRAGARAERAVYELVAGTLRQVPAGPVEVSAGREAAALTVQVRADAPPATLELVAARIDALGGALTIDARDVPVLLRAELPCAS